MFALKAAFPGVNALAVGLKERKPLPLSAPSTPVILRFAPLPLIVAFTGEVSTKSSAPT